MGGGGETSSSTSIDKEYNARMASIAEKQQDMGQGYYDFWMNNNAPLEQAKIAANMGLIPVQTDFQKAQIGAATELLPGQTEAQKAANTLSTAESGASLGLLPAKTEAMGSGYELANAQNNTALGLIPAQTEIANKYYDQALKGVNIEDRMGKATATVAGQYKDAGKTLTRQMGRTGSNPSSGMLVSAMNDLNMNRAKTTAYAKENTRTSAETENYNRLKTAKGFGLPSAQ
ncbi:MAG: hypothetical protein BA863_17885 [Desulfovibrio sp. S3730MH75]|nr:MAG: hypothetical protein BA863_17885 [Desulfovibrio sp. S3730MH75]